MSTPPNDKPYYYPCYCDWIDCEKISNIIQSQAPPGHPWRSIPIRVQFKERQPSKMTVTKSAFWQSARRHLRSNAKIPMTPPEITIHRHHFPTSFLDWNERLLSKRSICTSLNMNEAALISSHDLSHDRFTTVSNSVFTLHNRSIGKQQSTINPTNEKLKKKYVKSPFTTLHEVQSYIQTVTKARNLKKNDYITSISFEKRLDPPEPAINPTGNENEFFSIPPDVSDTLIKRTCDREVTSPNPTKFASIPTPSSIFPSKALLHDTLISTFYTLKGDLNIFMMNPTVQATAKMLFKFYEDDTKINLCMNNQVYYPCNNGKQICLNNTCEYFSISHRHHDNKLCSSCQKNRHDGKHNENRIVCTPKRKRPFSSLSPQDKVSAYSKSEQDVKNMRKKCYKLTERMKAKSTKFLFEDNSSAKKLMQDVIAHLQKDWDKTTDDIMAMMVELKLSDDENETVDIEERKDCAEYITDNIKNMSLQLNGKSKRSRYSSHILNISLAMYMRSQGSYNDLRKSGAIKLPCANTVQKLTESFKVKEGYDPNVNFLLDLEKGQHGNTIKGHLMMDEIKLKNGVLWNCSNNTVTGFVMEELNTTNMLKEILGMNDYKKIGTKQLAVYANQWRFRSTRGLTHNSNYYYNTGGLDGNMILSQFIDVLTTYELLGVQILGIVSDGGGSNTKFFNTLFEKKYKFAR